MTENEAIKYMLSYKFGRGRKPRYSDDEIDEAFNVAISALKEVQQYRKIGTVEECREAVEKQKAKKPEVIDQDFDYYKCPVCGEYIWATDNINDHKYCLNCGQAVTL